MKKIFQQIIALHLSIILVFTTCLLHARAEDVQVPVEEQDSTQMTEEKGSNMITEEEEPEKDASAEESEPAEESDSEKPDADDEPEASQPEDESQKEPEGTDAETEDTAVDLNPAEEVKKSKGEITEVKATAGGISIEWKKIDGAAGYYLERKLSGDIWKTIQVLKGMETVSYIDTEAAGGNTYSYRVKAYAEGEEITGKVSASKKIIYILPVTLSTEVAASGIKLRWNCVTKAKGYYIYRRVSTKTKWTKVHSISDAGEIGWCDTTAKNGKIYVYAVTAYNGTYESAYSNEKTYAKLTSPKIKSLTRKSSKKITVTWKVNNAASGYQIRCASNGFFDGAKKATIKDGSVSSYTFSNLAGSANYYVKIRAFRKENGKTYYSSWTVYKNIKNTRTAKVKVQKRKNKVFEVRSAAKQVLYQYDVLQGSCTDGVYSYYLLLNKTATLGKIVKVKHSTMKVKAVSEPLYVGHGNDMTYNPDKKCIVVAQSSGNDPKILISIDPKTLTIIENKKVSVPAKLLGATKTETKKISGFTGIAYNSTKKQYVALLRTSHNFAILDEEMNLIEYIKPTKKDNYVVQGIDVTDDYILLAQSPGSYGQVYNIITVYDWEGNYISKINVKKGYEIESIFHIGKKYYAAFYRSYYKTCYRTVVKKVKVNGKTKKKKVKEKYKKFMRDNYVYRITNI